MNILESDPEKCALTFLENDIQSMLHELASVSNPAKTRTRTVFSYDRVTTQETIGKRKKKRAGRQEGEKKKNASVQKNDVQVTVH